MEVLLETKRFANYHFLCWHPGGVCISNSYLRIQKGWIQRVSIAQWVELPGCKARIWEFASPLFLPGKGQAKLIQSICSCHLYSPGKAAQSAR